MNKKNLRREIAQKKAKKRRIAILAVCAVCVVAVVVALIIVNALQPEQPDSRVFAVADQSVALYDDGNFTARLAHNVNIFGTFTEAVAGNITEIVFAHDGMTTSTQIEDDVLLLPVLWRATCRFHSHEIEFPLGR